MIRLLFFLRFVEEEEEGDGFDVVGGVELLLFCCCDGLSDIDWLLVFSSCSGSSSSSLESLMMSITSI